MKSQHNMYYKTMSISFIRKVWNLLGLFAIHGCRGFSWWASSFFNAFWAFHGPTFTFSFGLHVEDCFLPVFSTAAARGILQRVLLLCHLTDSSFFPCSLGLSHQAWGFVCWPMILKNGHQHQLSYKAS